jgi:hypothetical protein
VFSAIISTNLIAQSVGLGNTDPSVFSKYRIPETNLSALWFNTDLNFNSDKNDQSDLANAAKAQFQGSDFLSSMNSNFQYSLTPTYYLLKQTDENWLSLNFTITGAYSYNYNDTKQQWIYPGDNTYFYSKHATVKSSDFNLNLQSSYGKYFSSGGFFYTFHSNISAGISSEYSDNEQLDYSLQSSDTLLNLRQQYNGNKSQNYSVSFGIGWGKIRDVTPVVSAIRLQERLKQLNLLNNDLSEKTIEDLSEQFSKSGYYSQIYDRSDKFFWQDIEKTLINDGVSLAGINQYGSSYLREVTSEIRFARSEGIRTGLNIMLNYDDSYSTNAGLFDPEHFYTLGNVYFNLSHQLNLNSQVQFSLSLSGGPNMTENSIVKQEYIISSNLGYAYEITDRIVATINNSFSCTFLNSNNQGKTLTNNFNLGINYFIEDHISLNASYQWNYNDSRYNEETNFSKLTEIKNYISIGFTYYINRGFLYN